MSGGRIWVSFSFKRVREMRSVLNWLRKTGLVAAVGVVCIESNAMGGVVINIAQSGSDVVATLSGSIGDLGTPLGTQNLASGQGSFIYTDLTFSEKGIRVARTGYTATTSDKYQISTSNQYWGPSTSFNFASSSNITGVDFFDVWGRNDRWFSLASNYVVGTSISGTVTWSNKTLADIGITNPGAFSFTVGSGANTDSIGVTISGPGAPVPEPTSMAIFGLGALGFAYRNRRKLMK